VSENKTNFIMAVRGYKSVKKETNVNCTDVTAIDTSNNKVIMRIIEPLGNECIGIPDVSNMKELISRDDYDCAILISKKFTDTAISEMSRHKIQYVSDDYMPPFNIQALYQAIVDCVNNQCMKKCEKVALDKSVCAEKGSHNCRIRCLAENAQCHFEEGLTGLLKNDLKMALALNR
jgi:hypothetical protein